MQTAMSHSSTAFAASANNLRVSNRRLRAPRSSPVAGGRRSIAPVAGLQNPQNEPLARALSSELQDQSPFLEPFVRSFILGVGTGAMLEAGHVVLQVMNHNFPGVASYSPLFIADHVTAFASWVAFYALEAIAVMAVLKRFDWDTAAAHKELKGLTTLPKKMLPLRSSIIKQFYTAGKQLAAEGNAPAVLAAENAAIETVLAAQAAPMPASSVQSPTSSTVDVISSPTTTRADGVGSVKPMPRRLPRQEPPEGPERENPHHTKRAKELNDRQGYLKNVWYAAALSDKVKGEPVKVQLCGKEMVLFRDADTGKISCIDNACPHRGAPLSDGWVQKKDGHNCVVCPYHGWALDSNGTLQDVPAANSKGEWPKRSLADSYPVEERGGFVWLFFGSKSLPEDLRPPIPDIPELVDPAWAPVYEEIEFECNHFGVFENAIDMAHIHYLHGDSFGNSSKPEIRDMTASQDEFSVTATFKIHNKAVNKFWEMFQVPVVEVTAKAFLPSTSLVSFTLANGLSFITVVNTVPISANRCINRFALVRKLGNGGPLSKLFNLKAWDFMARDAMMKIQLEDKEMVEKIKYDQVPAEYSVRADLPQVQFRKLRQRWVDMVGVVPTEEERPPYTVSNRDM